MRPGLKISLSLLISIVLCSAFTFFAFSGLFNFIESTFYNPRIKIEYQQRVDDLQDRIERYHRYNMERFAERIKPAYIAESFEPQISTDSLRQREADIAKLREQLPGLIMFRLVDQNRSQLHFSTLETDIRNRTEQSVTYFPVDQLEDQVRESWILLSGQISRLSLDGENRRFVYSLPVQTASGSLLGSAIFSVAFDDLYVSLLRSTEYSYGEFVPIDDTGLLFNYPEEKLELIQADVVSIWTEDSAPEAVQLAVSLEDEAYFLFTGQETEYGFVGFLARASNFELQLSMKIILLASVYLTVFLIIFLIFNLRQDPLISISQRLKRFQIDFLQDFVQSKEKVEWQRWKRDLSSRAPAIKKRMKSGLGRIGKAREEKVDELIDRSWDEILNAIGSQPSERGESEVDLSRIEQMLQRVMESGQLTVVAKQLPRPVQEGAVPGEAVGPEHVRATVKTEEIAEPEAIEEAEAAEELEELAEVGEEPAEELEELAEVGEEPAEEPEELAEVGEEAAEELEELAEVGEELAEEPEELAEAGEEPAEEPEELAEVEEEPVEEPEELAEVEEEAAEEPEELEEAGEEPVEELEELEEAGEEPVEELEELAEVEEEPAEEPEELAEVEEEAAEEPEELAGVLEYLEVIPEIEPLPPEPFEELEALPIVEEEPVQPQIAAIGDNFEMETGERDRESIYNEIAALEDLSESVKNVQSYPLEVVRARLAAVQRAIVLDGGVYKIKDDVYRYSSPDTRSELQKLVNTVLKRVGPVPRRIGRQKERAFALSEKGLDYDAFLAQFEDPENDRTKFKSLVEISKKIRAIAVVVFVEKEGSYEGVLTLGFSEKSISRLRLPLDDKLLSEAVEDRKITIFNDYDDKLIPLLEAIDEDDKKYMKRFIIFPAAYNGRDAAFLFVFAGDDILKLSSILLQLNLEQKKQTAAMRI